MIINMMNTMILSNVGFCHWFDDQSIRGMFNILLPEVNIFLERYLILQHAFGRKSVSLPKSFISYHKCWLIFFNVVNKRQIKQPFREVRIFHQSAQPYLISRSIIYGHKSKRTPQEQRKEPKSGRSLRFIEFRVLHFFPFCCYVTDFILYPFQLGRGLQKADGESKNHPRTANCWARSGALLLI